MCIADYRISRWVRTVYSEIVIPFQGGLLLPASNQRVGVEIHNPNAGSSFTIAIDKPAGQRSITIWGNATLPLKWTFAEDGDTPQRAFYAFTGVNALITFAVIERFLPQSVLDRELSQLTGLSQ